MAFAIQSVKGRATSWDAGKRHLDGLGRLGDANNRPSREGDGGNKGAAPPAAKNNNTNFSTPTATKAVSGSNRLVASKIRDFTADSSTEPGLYTQRKALASTPSATQDPRLLLSHPEYGLPKRLVSNLKSMGINLIYPWQANCLLRHRGVLSGAKNLVYSASTGAGKSLVADILMLKRVLDANEKAILVLPYVALVQEKLRWLRRAVDGIERNVELAVPGAFRGFNEHRTVRIVPFFGNSKIRATLSDADIAVCTIEKANSLINSAIEDGGIDDLGIAVLDEIHMVDDEYRGYLMELLATKLLTLQQDIQIVGMSATLSNTEDLARWLDAKYYVSNYKPVPVQEFLVCENRIYPTAGSETTDVHLVSSGALEPRQASRASTKPVRVIEPSKHPELKRHFMNTVVSLTLETVTAGFGVLVFCGSRAGCQSTAALVAKAMPDDISKELVERRREVLDSLKCLMLPVDSVLEVTIMCGVAFHHAGLTTEERDIVADAFDRGVLKVIVATCSLAAGINLPARRVILQEARMGREMVGPAMLRQMRGRAGRKGKDEIGESYVCCQKDDAKEVEQLLETNIPPISSCLTPGKRGIKRALLEVIAVRLATHEDAINDYIQKTLLYHNINQETLDRMASDSISQLIAEDLITQSPSNCYDPTPLGSATVAAGLNPEDSLFLHDEMRQALQHFVMDSDLHVFYLFTPISIPPHDIDWRIFLDEINELDESGQRVMSFCRINPAFINRMANSPGTLPTNTPEEVQMARVYRRFYAALQLRAICNEEPLHKVAARFCTTRGFVQSLSTTCHSFAAGIIKFCERLGWGMLVAVLEHMADRLRAGARADLLELARIPFVKSRTARALWENGYRNLRAVAEADAEAIAQVMLLAQPKRSKVSGEMEGGYLLKLKEKAEVVVRQAGRLWEREGAVDIEGEM